MGSDPINGPSPELLTYDPDREMQPASPALAFGFTLPFSRNDRAHANQGVGATSRPGTPSPGYFLGGLARTTRASPKARLSGFFIIAAGAYCVNGGRAGNHERKRPEAQADSPISPNSTAPYWPLDRRETLGSPGTHHRQG